MKDNKMAYFRNTEIRWIFETLSQKRPTEKNLDFQDLLAKNSSKNFVISTKFNYLIDLRFCYGCSR